MLGQQLHSHHQGQPKEGRYFSPSYRGAGPRSGNADEVKRSATNADALDRIKHRWRRHRAHHLQDVSSNLAQRLEPGNLAKEFPNSRPELICASSGSSDRVGPQNLCVACCFHGAVVTLWLIATARAGLFDTTVDFSLGTCSLISPGKWPITKLKISERT